MMDVFMLQTCHLSPLTPRFIHPTILLVQARCSFSHSCYKCLPSFAFSLFRHLDLSNNSLTTLPRNTLATAPLLETLALQDNPWSCDCRMNWFLTWILVHPGDHRFLNLIPVLNLFNVPHGFQRRRISCGGIRVIKCKCHVQMLSLSSQIKFSY